MKKGQTVKLILGGGPSTKAKLLELIPKKSSNPNSLLLEVKSPPRWLRKLEQSRGIFSGMPFKICVFRDHKGTWTDAQFMKQWKVE
jgi:hypothetical protein